MIWEYLVCEFDREVFHVSPDQHEPQGKYDIHVLGKRGWELVNISGWQLSRAVAIFKRPSSEADSDGCGAGCNCAHEVFG